MLSVRPDALPLRLRRSRFWEVLPQVATTLAVIGCASVTSLAQPTITNIGVLPGGFYSIGHATSADGSIVTGYSDAADGGRAFRWTAATGLESLGTLPSGTFSYALDISADGNVVAGTGDSTLGNRAFRWLAAGGMQDLGVLPGGSQSFAQAVSADGSVIAGTGDSTFGTHAFRWTALSGMSIVGGLPGGTFSQSFGMFGYAQFFDKCFD